MPSQWGVGGVLIPLNSFQTARYFGKDRARVRATRQVITGKVDWLPSIVVPEANGEVMAVLN